MREDLREREEPLAAEGARVIVNDINAAAGLPCFCEKPLSLDLATSEAVVAQADAAGIDMGDLVHQTAMYYEDRLGGAAFGRVVLAGGSAYGADAEQIRRQIEERLGTRVEPLDVRSGVTLRDRIAAGPELLDAIAPAVGVLLRDQPARGGERVA